MSSHTVSTQNKTKQKVCYNHYHVNSQNHPSCIKMVDYYR